MIARALPAVLLRRTACIIVLASCRLAAQAGAISPCDNPIVFPAATVQVFLFPYQAEGPLSARARQLATILQRHVLFAALKYPNIAVEQLTPGGPTDGMCRPDIVLQQIMYRLRLGQVVVILSGRLFEQNQQLELQSTVTYAVAKQHDVLTWKSPHGDATATLPPDVIRFAPRILPLSLLSGLNTAEQAVTQLHSAPTENAAATSLPEEHGARYGYAVLGTEADWMHIRLYPNGPEGWISAHALMTGDDLKGTFPELFFVDGLVGYGELVAHQSSFAAASAASLSNVNRSLDRYLELSSNRAESLARVYAAVLKGSAYWRASDGSDNALLTTYALYRAAEAMSAGVSMAAPFSLAAGLASCLRDHCGDGADDLESRFLDAIARDPTDTELLTNLSTLYTNAADGFAHLSKPPEKISAQRAVLQRVLLSSAKDGGRS